jgi:hypothetical protein
MSTQILKFASGKKIVGPIQAIQEFEEGNTEFRKAICNGEVKREARESVKESEFLIVKSS